jgi:1A family penicillin-binding protein
MRALFSVAALIAVVLAMLIGSGLAYAFVSDTLKGLPDINDPNAFKVAQPTRIISYDHKLLATFYLENRQIVSLSAMSTDLPHAVVAVEDERFYQHGGFDPYGIARAVLTDLASGHAAQGASTITQQYVRNTILSSERNDLTAARKIREMYLANQLEQMQSKNQILEDYLNTVYFGEGAYGAEAAAKVYFGKSAKDLTLAQAAMLAGLPQSPSNLDPYHNMPGAITRQHWVLDRMVANYPITHVTRAMADAAEEQTITLHPALDPAQGIYDCGYFVSYVRRLLLQKYSNTTIFKGGLTVYTTIDTRDERYAERAVKDVLPSRRDPDAALVSIDPNSGFIKAMYGGRGYAKSSFNTATQAHRQPGSSFKMFVLVTALEKGVPPKAEFDSSSPAVIPSNPPWHVSNSEGKGTGYMTLSQATADSVNCVFARLIWELGPANVARTAKRMGIVSPIPALPSIALGSAPVTPLEMASAYGTLASGGIHYTDPVYNQPAVSIIKVVDSDGNTIYQYAKHGTRVLSPKIAWAATQQLMGVVSGGTGTAAQLSGREVAGKTGTAQDYHDAWFVGYTPQLVTAVWMGYLKGAIPMTDVHGQRAFGGTFCAPIWHDFMSAALARMRSARFARAGSPSYTWNQSWSPPANQAVAPVKSASARSRVAPKRVVKPKKPKKKKTGTGSGGTGGTGGGTGGGGTTTSTP